MVRVSLISKLKRFFCIDEEVSEGLSAAEISAYKISTDGVYYRSNNLYWYEMTDYIDDELIDHFDSLRNVGFLTPGKVRPKVSEFLMSMGVRKQDD